MTSHQLGRLLLAFLPDMEVGYFDGEGHWLQAGGLRITSVDAANWHPLPHEVQTGALRRVLEIVDVHEARLDSLMEKA
jgi:hypothetical protein